MSKKIRMVEGTPRIDIKKVIPYANNARINDHAVPALMASIRKFGFNEPIVLDKNNVIVCGHTRVKAASRLGMKEVPCVFVEGLTQAEIDAYRLADNKVAEQAMWDYEKLNAELKKIGDDIAMTDFGFTFDDSDDSVKESAKIANGDGMEYMPRSEINENAPINNESDEANEECEGGKNLNGKYSQSVGHVTYEPKNTNHRPCDLFKENTSFRECIAKVKNEEIRRMLELRSAIFTDFNFTKIADYYAYQASQDEKKAFERLALVVLDRDDLIANGFSDIIEEVKNGKI